MPRQIIGAEESLRARLTKLEGEKSKALAGAKARPKTKPEDAKELPKGETPDCYMVPQASKKASKRENKTAAEDAESQEWILPESESPQK